MSFLDGLLRGQASTQISKYGKWVEFIGTDRTMHDASTHALNETEKRYRVKAVLENYTDYYINGQTIQSGDLKITVAAKGAQPPEVDWGVSIPTESGEQLYNVISVSPIYSGEQIAIYQCQVRK